MHAARVRILAARPVFSYWRCLAAVGRYRPVFVVSLRFALPTGYNECYAAWHLPNVFGWRWRWNKTSKQSYTETKKRNDRIQYSTLVRDISGTLPDWIALSYNNSPIIARAVLAEFTQCKPSARAWPWEVARMTLLIAITIIRWPVGRNNCFSRNDYLSLRY